MENKYSKTYFHQTMPVSDPFDIPDSQKHSILEYFSVVDDDLITPRAYKTERMSYPQTLPQSKRELEMKTQEISQIGRKTL